MTPRVRLALLGITWAVIYALALLALDAAMSNTARGDSASARHMGHAVFCAEYRSLCVASGGRLPTTAELEAVDASVNAAIAYAPDSPVTLELRVTSAPTAVTLEDHWVVSPARGDCDDYAVTKLAALVAAGVDRAGLRLALGFRLGEPHAVLVARADDGEWYALDNAVPGVVALSGRSDLTLVAVESPISHGRMALVLVGSGAVIAHEP